MMREAPAAIEARDLVKDFAVHYDYGSIKRMMLDIRALRRRETKIVRALKGIDLTVEQGETVALIDASHPVVHVEFRIGDPHRQAKMRAVMDRLRVGNRFRNR